MLGNYETRSLDRGLAGKTSVVTSLDLFGAIWDEKIESWEEQGEEEGTECGEQRVEESLKDFAWDRRRRVRRGFLKDSSKKPSINEAVVSEWRV